MTHNIEGQFEERFAAYGVYSIPESGLSIAPRVRNIVGDHVGVVWSWWLIEKREPDDIPLEHIQPAPIHYAGTGFQFLSVFRRRHELLCRDVLIL